MNPQPPQSRGASFKKRGSTIVTVLGVVITIALASSAVLTRSMSTFRQVNHIASWQESLLAAEAGSESALFEMRQTLINPNAFQGWTKLNANQTSNGTIPANAGFDILKPNNFPVGGIRYVPTQI